MGAVPTLSAAVRAAAAGRYDAALAGCRAVHEQGAVGGRVPDDRVASLALSLEGSIWRQVGDPALALAADRRALERVWAAPVPDRLCDNGSCRDPGHRARADAEADATANLVADAVAAGDLTAAHGRAAAAADAVSGSAGEAGAWRREVRLGWVLAETALLADRPDEAVSHASRALTRSRTGRHAAKSRLVLAVAEQSSGEPGAVGRLATAYDAATRLGLDPLVVVAGTALLSAAPGGRRPGGGAPVDRDAVADAVAAAAGRVRSHLPDEVAGRPGWWSVPG